MLKIDQIPFRLILWHESLFIFCFSLFAACDYLKCVCHELFARAGLLITVFTVHVTKTLFLKGPKHENFVPKFITLKSLLWMPEDLGEQSIVTVYINGYFVIVTEDKNCIDYMVTNYYGGIRKLYRLPR
jgi:hypothetical protein